MAVVFVLAVFFVAWDRFLKMLAVQYLSDKTVPLINGILSFDFVSNYRIALSLPLSGWWLNVFIFLLIAALLFAWLGQIKKRRFSTAAALTFLIIGAISNLLDRLLYGYVIDYFDWRIFTNNIADIMIATGTSSLILLFILKSNHAQNYNEGR